MNVLKENLIQLGEPIEHRGATIAPLFPRLQPRAGYVTLDEALPLGFLITELDSAGAVPELLAVNPLESDVLLYDGQELIGAKQNRILNITVLVAAQSEVRIPVSCVEEGRWSPRSAPFAAAHHTAHPELRRRKARTLSSQPLARGVAQSEVWNEIRAKIERLDAPAPTHAQADAFKSRERQLASLREAFPIAAGQCGAVFATANGICLDYVSRPDAFASLYPKLLNGYLLDAIEELDNPPAAKTQISELIGQVESARRSVRPSASLGDDIRLIAPGIVGSGLQLNSELIQLCAFSAPPIASSHTTRITSPSRRR